MPVTVQGFLKAVEVCPWLCKMSTSVPVTVQAFLKSCICVPVAM